MALPKQNRLRSSRDFGKVYRKGKKAATEHLVLRALRVTAKTKNRKPEGQVAKSKQLVLKANRLKDRQSVDERPSALSSCFGISISKKVRSRSLNS